MQTVHSSPPHRLSCREAMEACAFSRCLLLPRSVPFAKKLPSPSPVPLWFLREGSFTNSKFSKPSRVLYPAPCASPSSSSSECDLALLFEVEGLRSKFIAVGSRKGTLERGVFNSTPCFTVTPYRAYNSSTPGVIADVYRFGNRQAFNVAFQKLGLDCANWPEPVYVDLMRRSGRDEEKMLTLFFNRIGWPTSLPTNEKDSFVKSVLRQKKKALEEYVSSSDLPLRPGVESFIDDALKAGIHVVMLTTYGRNGEKTARSLIEKLGQDRVSKVKIVGKKEVEESFYGQLILGKGLSSSLDEKLLKEATKAAFMEKKRIAEEVASILKLSVDISTPPSEGFEMVVATLRAGAELADLPVKNCVLISGSQTGVLAAERVSMPCVVIRNSLTARAEFHSAKVVMDGFGGADLTISKVRSKIGSSE